MEWWEATSKEVQRVQEITGQERCRTKGCWSWEHGKEGYLGGRGCCVGKGRRRSSSCRITYQWMVLLLLCSVTTGKLHKWKTYTQHYIESQSHICPILPKFHCKLNPIEMLWGFMKYHTLFTQGFITRKSDSNHKFRLPTAFRWFIQNSKKTHPWVPWYVQYINHPCFFCKAWHYMDAYQSVF